jgi:hypothetical protein
MNVQERVATIVKAVNELVDQSKQIITEATVEWLNGPEAAKAGVDKVVFGGYTPSFNDGEPCTFSMGEVYATNMPGEDITSMYSYDDADEETNVVMGRKAPAGFVALDEMINSLNQVNVIERTFGSYGFIVIVHKDGTLEEKEYECGY